MRIGINLLYLIPGVVGGTETYARAIIEHLLTQGQHEYVVFLNGNTSRSDLILPDSVEVVQLQVDAQSREKRYMAEQFILPWRVQSARIDVLHSMGYVGPIFSGVPHVVTIHDVNYKHVPMPFSKRTALGWFMSQAARSAQAVVTVSEFSKREICSAFGLRPEKVWVTYNAPSADIFEQGGARSGGVEESSPYLLVLSSPSPHKNIDGFVRGFELLAQRRPDIRLKVAGHLAPTIRVPGDLAERIDILGYVSRTTLLNLYRSAACFVMPSFYEGFGIPVIEAMALGTPVACSNQAALPEVVGDAAVQFNPHSPEEMADAVLRLLEDGALAQALTRRGRERARAFSWEESAARTLEVYETVATGRVGQ